MSKRVREKERGEGEGGREKERDTHRKTKTETKRDRDRKREGNQYSVGTSISFPEPGKFMCPTYLTVGFCIVAAPVVLVLDLVELVWGLNIVLLHQPQVDNKRAKCLSPSHAALVHVM